MDGRKLLAPRSRDPSSSRQAEQDLLARIERHDEQAFEAFYRDFHPRLTRFLTNIIRRPQIVEEVLDDTMIVVWTRPDSFRGESRLSTWLFAIAYRKAMRALRRQDIPMQDPDWSQEESLDPAPDDQSWSGQRERLLREAIAQLSADHRAVVDLTNFHELGYREIAQIVGCPVDTVKTRMFHARKRLRSLMAGEINDWL